MQVRSLLDTDDPDSIKQPPVQSDVDIPKKRRRRGKLRVFCNKCLFFFFFNSTDSLLHT